MRTRQHVATAIALVLFSSAAYGQPGVLPGNAASPQTADAWTPEQVDLIALDDAWIDAEVRGDREALERILHEEFLATFASGRTVDRDAYIDWIVSADIEPFEVVHEVIRIHGDTALVIDRSLEGRTKFTYVAVRRQGRWRVISETFTAVADPSETQH